MRAGIASLLLVGCALAVACSGRKEQHIPSPPEIKRQSAAGAVIPAGTIIVLRIVDPIATSKADDSLGYAAVTARDIPEQSGKVLILAGSPAILGVAQSSSGLSLVLRSVMINGNNYPTAGKSALLGALVQALAPGVESVPPGPVADGAITVEGASINVPRGSLLTFQLAQPFTIGEGSR
ncbi:MAG: hypothetical protein LC130_20920 [Bryobacterales bacterium]|nr:hypothetical protein [Bryobacterales bacterium]MEB2363944.1 hypothetical protein [Bryobacterales bacterium]